MPGKPINIPLIGTVDCAVWLTIRSSLLETVSYGDISQNSGLTRPIEIVAPKGFLPNPIFPAPVTARFCSGNQRAGTVMRSFSQVVTQQVSAGIGNLRVVAISGRRDGTHWVHMEIMEGSYGMDGIDAVDTLYANTRTIRSKTSNPTSGCGSTAMNCVKMPWPKASGIGAIREFTFLDDAGFSL